MINNKNLKSILELQKIAQSYSKEFSKAIESWQKMGIQVKEAVKPFHDNMESIRKGMDYLTRINLGPYTEILNNLRNMEERISNFTYPVIRLPEITPMPYMPKFREGEKLKRLIKESIIELEQERSKERESEVRKLSKKRKIGGFSREGEET